MRRRFSRLTRRSLIGAIVGLVFAAAAGVGLAQITTSSGPTLAATTTTESQTTGTQTTTNGDQGESGDDQGENEQGNSDFQSEHGNGDEHDAVEHHDDRRRGSRPGERSGEDGRLPPDR